MVASTSISSTTVLDANIISPDLFDVVVPLYLDKVWEIRFAWFFFVAGSLTFKDMFMPFSSERYLLIMFQDFCLDFFQNNFSFFDLLIPRWRRPGVTVASLTVFTSSFAHWSSGTPLTAFRLAFTTVVSAMGSISTWAGFPKQTRKPSFTLTNMCLHIWGISKSFRPFSPSSAVAPVWDYHPPLYFSFLCLFRARRFVFHVAQLVLLATLCNSSWRVVQEIKFARLGKLDPKSQIALLAEQGKERRSSEHHIHHSLSHYHTLWHMKTIR